MAKNQTVYCVDSDTNEVVRVSRTFLAAIEFAAKFPQGAVNVYSSIFPLKKGDQMVDGEVLA